MKLIRVKCKDYREGNLVERIKVSENFFVEIYQRGTKYTWEFDIPHADIHWGGYRIFNSLQEAKKDGVTEAKKEVADIARVNKKQTKEIENFKKILRIPIGSKEPHFITNVRGGDNNYLITWFGVGFYVLLDYGKSDKGELWFKARTGDYTSKKFPVGQYEKLKKYMLEQYENN